jgi:transposase
MTLQPRDWTIIPEQTAQIARAAFPKGNIYMKMRDELGVLYADNDFVTLFRADCGQPPISPAQLALVTVMQFAERLSDRQTADAVRARLDWKYALGLELTNPGFDFSVFLYLAPVQVFALLGVAIDERKGRDVISAK